jgi:hypothetical protein
MATRASASRTGAPPEQAQGPRWHGMNVAEVQKHLDTDVDRGQPSFRAWTERHS